MNTTDKKEQTSSTENMEEAFSLIMKAIEKEEYELCSVHAFDFIKKCDKHGDEFQLLPFAYFFKLFSEAYRTWQFSYNYTPIRNQFFLAYKALFQGLEEVKTKHKMKNISKDNETLRNGFENLTEMLCNYTKCENSTINNDPFALELAAKKAWRMETKTLRDTDLRNLSNGKSGNVEKAVDTGVSEKTTAPYRIEIAAWIRKYMNTNRMLHKGLMVCADCYGNLLKKQRPMTAIEEKKLTRIEKSLVKLNKLSSELSSELNAHIRHIRQHNTRLKQNIWNNTFLRINKGSLVNLMSVAFDPDSARSLRKINNEIFINNINEGLKNLGVEVCGYQTKQLPDLFKTSFGESNLNVISFSLTKKNDSLVGNNIKINILDKAYNFDIRFSISALGVCTAYFTLDIDKPENALKVEEARTLQSLICPHSGQVKIEETYTDESEINDFKLLERIELREILDELEVLRSFPKEYKSLDTEVDNFISVVNKIACGMFERHELNKPGNIPHKEELVTALKNLNKAVHSEKIKFSKKSSESLSAFEIIINKINKSLNSHRYVTHLAEQYLNIIGAALAKTLNQTEINFKITPDTGWFTYLHCHSIDEVRMADGKVLQSSAGFDKIANHQDMIGFIIEQREARSSFDDWRFIMPFDWQGFANQSNDQKNLAHIRSHQADGFFCTEYQAFLYFPDDPMFLTDVYNTTVKLMLRLATVLRYNSVKAQQLAEQIHNNLHNHGQNITLRILDHDLSQIRKLRLHAEEIQTLVARAAISRYKDHGELMKGILREMKLDQMANLLEQQLQHLSEIYADTVAKSQERREKKASHAIEFLATIIAFSAVKDFVDSVFEIKAVEIFLISLLGGGAKGIITLIIMGVAIVVLIYVFYRWRWKQSD